jgi:glycosyltransferase involved in cell wall biosynthesis
LERVAQPGKWFDELRGREDFRYPETSQFLNFSPVPDIVHCHNLHGHYFDLRILPELSQKIPTVLTLHDAWLLSGHCAHSFDCERWKSGCGECPDLTIYPSIEKDATAFNWQRKKEIYKRSRLHVATPSQWLMDKVQESMLIDGIVESRVIPNGVDLTIFSPSDKPAARNKLGLPSSANIVLLASYDNHQWKDSPTIRAAVELMSRTTLDQLVFIVLGNRTGIEKIGSAELKFISEQKDPADVAEYYRAADLYIHVSKADTFPNSVLESLACGTPVVATAIGGIPEQIKSLAKEEQEATGVLVPPKNPVLISQNAIELLTNRNLLLQMGKNASRDAMERFGLNKQIDSYLSWYSEILNLSSSRP